VSYLLSLVPLLVCPVGMGLMMVFVGRMMNHGGPGVPESVARPIVQGRTSMPGDDPSSLAERRAAIVAELESMGETAAPEPRTGVPSCCAGGNKSQKQSAAGGQR
jgi:hypothetical protein